jgi:hypothetical protein
MTMESHGKTSLNMTSIQAEIGREQLLNTTEKCYLLHQSVFVLKSLDTYYGLYPSSPMKTQSSASCNISNS